MKQYQRKTLAEAVAVGECCCSYFISLWLGVLSEWSLFLLTSKAHAFISELVKCGSVASQGVWQPGPNLVGFFNWKNFMSEGLIWMPRSGMAPRCHNLGLSASAWQGSGGEREFAWVWGILQGEHILLASQELEAARCTITGQCRHGPAV